MTHNPSLLAKVYRTAARTVLHARRRRKPGSPFCCDAIRSASMHLGYHDSEAAVQTFENLYKADAVAAGMDPDAYFQSSFMECNQYESRYKEHRVLALLLAAELVEDGTL